MSSIPEHAVVTSIERAASKPFKIERNRIWEIDFLRGLCIFLVCIDHMFYNFTVFDFFVEILATNPHHVSPFFTFMQDIADEYSRSPIQTAVRFAIVFIFLLVSGVSSAFSKDSGKRVLKLLIGSAFITLLTVVVFLLMNHTARMPFSMYIPIIIFGILMISALSAIIYMLTRKTWNKWWFFLGTAFIIIALIAFLVFLTLNPKFVIHRPGGNIPGHGTIFIFSILMIVAISVVLYMLAKKIWDNKWFFLGIGVILMIMSFTFGWFGYGIYLPVSSEWSLNTILRNLVGTEMYGGDFYGVLPWTGMFMIGVFFGKVLYADKKSCLPFLIAKRRPFSSFKDRNRFLRHFKFILFFLARHWQTPTSFAGRKTMVIYVLHQPAIIALMLIIGLIAGYRLW